MLDPLQAMDVRMNTAEKDVVKREIDPNEPDGLRSGNEIMVGLNRPPSDKARNFNENDILGDLPRDAAGQFVLQECQPKKVLCGKPAAQAATAWMDKQDRKVTERGYLVNAAGDVTNQRGEIVFK